jgi:type IV pilus assembly protein PilQ
MKRIKTYVGLAGMIAFALTVHAEQTTPPADPAFTNPDLVSEQESQVLDSQDNTAPAEVEAIDDAEASKEEALYAALRSDQEATEEASIDTAEEPSAEIASEDSPAVEAAEETVEASEVVVLAQAEVEDVVVDIEETEAPVVEEELVVTEESVATEEETLVDSEEATVVIPLIVMDEVPLMDAIRNLARQAMINYMVDPRVPYGQMGDDGVMTPQPILSIRWENVTAEQALVAVLNNYNLQMSEDPKAKIYRVTVKDPAAPDPLVTEIIQLKYASPSNVVAAVQSSFVDKRSKVVADVRTSQIVVVTTEKELVSIMTTVEELDKPTRQVLIEARLYETTANPSTVKGIDWTGTLKDQTVTFGNDIGGTGNLFAQTVGSGMAFSPDTFFLTADGLSVALNFLNENSESKAVATPRAVTLDNERARLEVTRAFPIFKNTAGTQGSPGGSEVTYTNLGVILNVTPRISANDTVNLKVIPEVSTVFDTIEKVVADTRNEADVYDIRRIETRVLIPSGNTLVLGGLLRDTTRENNIKVPILGDIPGLGLLFRQDSKQRDKVNLITFITPTIVEDADFQPTPSDYLKTKFEEPDMKPWSAWDSGKPKDWSKRKD